MNRLKAKNPYLFISVTFLLFTGIMTVSAQDSTGGRPALHGAEFVESQSLSQVVNEFGQISLSLDALGTLNTSGTIQVEKPEGATVRKAYLMSATTGFTGSQLNSGDVKILGNDIVWETELANSISSYNYWADVTAMIKSNIDSAPAGLVDLEITESLTNSIDGEILAVIFDDPNQTTNNTVLLYFGAQNVNGDSFVIDFGTPIDKDDPNLVLDYSLGISYGCQATSGCSYPPQYSIVDINGNRLTTSAGGEDDGVTSNGALITVGGIGDSNDNPPDPNAVPVNQHSDDELYDLEPFVNDGDTSIQIDTNNPSHDDNILFVAVFLGSTRNIPAVDVDISLYNNPTGEDREPYDNIIRFFANGVYESSNGAHKLGTVTFHTSGENANESDVVWVEKCHPSANAAGIASDGLHVNMCDIFEDGGFLWFDYDFLSNNAHQRMGGYTLAHEWGHYYYSLYDEYVGDGSNDNLIFFPHSTDQAVPNSIMNSQWNAHSFLGGDDFNWLNFSVPQNDTQQNAQHRVYGASAWDTLTRPVSEDPRDGERVALPVRVYYPELVDVKPEENQDARIDLPGTAQSALNIVWPDASTDSPVVASLMDIPYWAQLTSLLGQNISYPNPILLLAFVHKDVTITDMTVQGTVQLPDGAVETVTFTDDGVSPDAAQGDGLYSALLGYEEDGIYTIQVAFDNTASTAKFVYTAFAPARGEEGPVPLPAPVPIAENFMVSKTIQVSVSNVALDDYGDTPGEAYMLSATNVPYPGKIDFAGDKDVFQFATLQNEETYVRITGLALAMDPHLRILAADMTTVLFSASLDPDISEYLFIPLAGVQPGTTVYAEVSDQTNTAYEGLYEFSVGRKLAGDSFLTSYLYLPMVKH
jgi:hypothetical protein